MNTLQLQRYTQTQMSFLNTIPYYTDIFSPATNTVLTENPTQENKTISKSKSVIFSRQFCNVHLIDTCISTHTNAKTISHNIHSNNIFVFASVATHGKQNCTHISSSDTLHASRATHHTYFSSNLLYINNQDQTNATTTT